MTGKDDTGLSHQVWKYPCNHKIKIPDTFTPAESCPKCKDARGPEKFDGPQVNMTDVAADLAQERVDLKNDLREKIEEWREFAEGEAFDDYGKGVDEATLLCANELEELIEDE